MLSFSHHVLPVGKATVKRRGRVVRIEIDGVAAERMVVEIHDCLLINREEDEGPERIGLCSDRNEHKPHEQHSKSLGTFWCTADQSQREPGRSERRKS